MEKSPEIRIALVQTDLHWQDKTANLAMLEEKTRGNLSEDENRLMTHILYELRLLYVKKRVKNGQLLNNLMIGCLN